MDNQLILANNIDPQEWKQEVERVEFELDNIEKDLLLIKQRGASPL